jgi:hypothetical protein
LDAGAAAANRNAVHGEIYEHDVADIDRPEPGLLFHWCIAGDWKLIESADYKVRELYNVSVDPREEKNLAASEAGRLEELNERILFRWTDIEERLKRAAKAFTKIGPVAKSIVSSKEIQLFEGLPHQYWEKELLDEELKSKRIVQLYDFPFYQEKRAMAEADAAVVRRILSDVRSVEAWRGEKLCGGYHPDYLLEWRAGEEVYQVQICLGCHELKFFAKDLKIDCDVHQDACEKLATVLKKYQKNRPMSKR